MRKNYNGSVTQLVDMLHRAIYISMNTAQQYLDIYLIALSSKKGFLNLKVRLNVESTFCSLARFHNSANLKICNPIILLLNLSITNHSKKSLDIDETMSPQKITPTYWYLLDISWMNIQLQAINGLHKQCSLCCHPCSPSPLSDFEANKRGSNVHLDKNPKNIPALLQLIIKAEWMC